MQMMTTVGDMLGQALEYFDERFHRLLTRPDRWERHRVEGLICELCSFIGSEWNQRMYEAGGDAWKLPMERIRQAAIECSARLEREAACGGLDGRLSHYFNDVSQFCRAEIEAARVTPRSHVLFVGSGPFPVSAITLARETGCTVSCLDIDAEAVRLSQRLLADLGLAHRVTVSCREVADFDCDNVSHVFIASLVPHKERILETLHARLSATALVAVRYGNGFKQLFNYGLDDLPESRWKVVSRLETRSSLHYTIIVQRRKIDVDFNHTVRFQHTARSPQAAPLKRTLIVGSGAAGCSLVPLLDNCCDHLTLSTRHGANGAALLEALEADGGVLRNRVVRQPELGGAGRIDAFHMGSDLAGCFDTVFLCTPADSYAVVAGALARGGNLHANSSLVLLSAPFGSSVEVGQALRGFDSVEIVSCSSYFGSSRKAPEAPNTVVLGGIKRRVYVGSNQEESAVVGLLSDIWMRLGVNVEIMDSPLHAESRNITTYVHPALFMNEVALSSILTLSPSGKYMYKLYPEGPITKERIADMVRLTDEIGAVLSKLGIEPLNLLKFLNDDNYPVHEQTLSREEIEQFPSRPFIERTFLLYVRYTALLVDPFSSPDPATGRYADFSAISFTHARKLPAGRIELPRIPLEDFRSVEVMRAIGRRVGVPTPQMDKLCRTFRECVAVFERRQQASVTVSLDEVEARCERLAESIA